MPNLNELSVWVLIPAALMLIVLTALATSFFLNIKFRKWLKNNEPDKFNYLEELNNNSDNQYSVLINNMQDGVFVLKDIHIRFANTAFALMIGYKAEELIGKTPKIFTHRDDFLKVVKIYKQILAGDKITDDFEIRLINKNSGNNVFVHIHLSAITYREDFALLGTVKNITTRKKQEDILRKLSAAVEQSPNSVLITDLDGLIEYVNPRFTELTGFSLHDVFKENTRILKSGNMPDEIYKEMWDTILAGNTWRGEIQNKKKNGELYWVSAAITPVKNEYGKVTHFLAIEMDITYQKFVQEEIKTHKQRLDSILNNMPVILFALDKEDNISFLQGHGLEVFGIDTKEFIGVSARIVFQNYKEILSDLSELRLGNNEPVIRRIGKNYLEIHYSTIQDKQGNFNGINGIAYDVTERFKAQTALKESEERFRSLYENSSVGIYRSTPDGKVLMANPTLVKMLGYEEFSELEDVKITDKDFHIEIDRAEYLHRLETEGIVQGMESVWKKKDGSQVFVRESARAVKNEKGTIIYFDGVIEDITLIKKTEQQLYKSEAKNEALLEAMPDVIFEISTDGYITTSQLTETDRESLGLPDEVIGKHISELTSFSVAEKTLAAIVNALKSDEIQIFEFSMDSNNVKKFFEARIKISGLNSVIAIVRDITTRKEGEELLIKAKEEAEKNDKLKTAFLAQMSHEIRTPINSILSFTSLLREEMQEKVSSDLKMSFDAIDNGSHRLIRTIDSILNMSQLQTGTYNPIIKYNDLDKDILKPAFTELKAHAVEKNLELNYILQTDKSMVRCDNYTTGQIFVNLIDNAIKYTNSGKVTIKLYKNKNGNIAVDINDTGIGISEEFLPNLFQAFSQEETGYTRKYEGNGLGLALVKNYADINNAFIKVASKKGEGTTFSVIFNEYNN